MKLPRTSTGFTLIELMITVAIIGILAAIAIPSYRDYVIRGQLVNATTALSGMRAKMEQYYQDNRQYTAVGSGSTATNPPCATVITAGNFSVSCTGTNGGTAPTGPSDTVPNTYKIGAKATSGPANGFTFTIDQTNMQQTTAAPTGWSTNALPVSCWVVKKGTAC